MTRWLLARLWRGSGPWQWLLAGVLVGTVALATLMVLFLASIPAALDRQESRLAWTQAADWTQQADPAQDSDYVLIHSVIDRLYAGDVTVVNVAVRGAGIAPPPGVPVFPAPGEVLLSPALQNALQDRGDQERYGQIAGLVGPQAIAGPDALLALRGVEYGQLSPVAVPARGLSDTPQSQVDPVLALVLTLAGAALLAPPLLLAYVSTRAASRTRQRRAATLVIAGVSRRLLTRLVAVEAAVGAGLGALLGLGLLLLLRPALAPLVVEPPVPFATDLTPPWAVVLLTLLLLPLLVVLIALRTARRSVRDPLASVVTAREGGGTRLWAGLGILVLVAGVASGLSGVLPRSQAVIVAMVSGGLALLLLAPAVCRGLGAALLRSSHGSAVLAGGSLAASPRAAARLVSTASLAVFVATTFVLVFPTAVKAAYRDQPVIEQSDRVVSVQLQAAPPEQVEHLAGQVFALPEVEAVATVLTGQVQTGSSALGVWIGDCPAVVEAADMDPASCSPDHAVTQTPTAQAELSDAGEAQISDLAPREVAALTDVPDFDAPSALPLPEDRVLALQTSGSAVDRPQIIVDAAAAALDASAFRPTLLHAKVGDPAAVDQIRRLALQADPTAQVATRESSQQGFDGGLRRYYALMSWGAALTMITAAAGVFTGAVSGHIERARTTSVLRAVGARVATLRRASLLAILAPLATMSALALLLGLLSALLIVPGTTPVWAALQGLWPVLLGLGLTALAGAAASWLVGATSTTTQIRHE